MSEVTITCLCCGDIVPSPDGTADYVAHHITHCSVCNALVMYGVLAPKIVVEPGTFDTADGPRPAFVFRYVDRQTGATLYETKIDPRSALLQAQAVISMVRV